MIFEYAKLFTSFIKKESRPRSNMVTVLRNALFLFAIVTLATPAAVRAQNIPGPADVGRVESGAENILPPRQTPKIMPPRSTAHDAPVVEGTDAISFILESLTVSGMTALHAQDIADIYAQDVGKEIPLSRIWEYARRVTQRYHDHGYFLSRAYVPAQEIDQGHIKIEVIEGYIGEVIIDDESNNNYVVDILRRRLLSQRPLQFSGLENALLLLNDFPGGAYESILSRIDNGEDGATRLTLKKTSTAGRGKVVLDNFGSRFTGPHRTSFAYENIFFPLQTTTVSGLANLPDGKKLRALHGTHRIAFLPEFGVKLSAGHTISNPEYTLKSSDIDSKSLSGSLGLDWKMIRQRDESLTAHLSLDVHNVTTNTQKLPLTRDRVRAVRAGIDFDTIDFLGGSNFFTATLSKGIASLGASKASEQNLSRAEAKPDFTKFESTWRRQQPLSEDWLATTLITSQLASKPLYSSEEFGFGGPALGRAYDSSEITGDHGLAGAIEVHYVNLPPLSGLKLVPSMFYDIGKVWNVDSGEKNSLSAASFGLGLNISHRNGISSSLTVAQPLTKSIDTSVYGNNGKNLRLYFQMGWQF